jgi:hypothetical protein
LHRFAGNGVDGEVMRAAVLSAFLLLAACRDERPPMPTAEESEQLNEVEELLNEEAKAQENAQ